MSEHSEHRIWQRAAGFAARAHRHQVRKDGITPYASHPFRVAMTVRHVFECDDANVIAAAMLHDVIEDCDVDYDEVLEAFNREVADLVACMTKDMRLVEEMREEAYDRQLAAGPWKARLIKLADQYDNVSEAGRDGAALEKTIGKARRALALAANDAPLKRAAALLESLIEDRLAESSDFV